MKRIFLALYGALLAMSVQAQTAPTVQLTCAPTSGISPASVTLTWSSTAAQSCTGSGSWTGTKPSSGTQTIADLRADASYTLTCKAAPTLGSARLSWVAPTANTDGSALTNLAGYRVHYGTSATALTQTVQIANPAATSYTVSALNSATWYFAARAYTSTGAESAVSNTVTKTVVETPGASASAQCAIDVDTRPAPPTSLQVIETTARDIDIDWTVPRLVAGPSRGRIALGTPCLAEYAIADAFYGVAPDQVEWEGTSRAAHPVARCGLVVGCPKCEGLQL